MRDYSRVDFFTDPSLLEDPFPYFEWLRSRGPVWREPVHGMFMVTGYDEIAAVFRDPEAFSSCNAFGGPPPELPEAPDGDDASGLIEKYRDRYPASDSLIAFDPPKHAAHRGLMMRLLTPNRLRENEAFMWRCADERIDAFIDKGKCEFLGDYAQPFALVVIADLLGIPEADHALLRGQIVARGAPGAISRRSVGSQLGYLDEFFTPYVEERRSRPRDDVLTKMALATFPDGSTPQVIDVVRVAAILFAAGQGTAARFLGAALKLIAEQPEIQQQLREQRERIPSFVEEMLRLHSPTKVSFRMARRATALGGVDVPAGSTLVLLLAAADRDPRRFEHPAEFRGDRPNARDHVAFGRGIHSCPGGPLVRSEARITLERFLDRMADIRISQAEHGPPGRRRYDYTPSYILRGVEALHLEFTPTGRGGSAKLA
jgi:cytochrome P450